MSTMTIEREVHFGRKAQGRVMLKEGTAPAKTVPGRVPRVAKLLALAHRFEEYLNQEQVRDQSELAELGRVSRARISQILNLLNLAPDIQDSILYLAVTKSGRDPIILQQLQPIASTLDWNEQRRMWIRCQPMIATHGTTST